MNTTALKVGSGKAKIDFKDSDFPIKDFDGIHDDLHIRVIMVKGKQTIVFVSVELTSLPDNAIEFYKNIVNQETAVPLENIWITVTHTFATPHIPPIGKTEDDIVLISLLFKRTSEALRKALKQSQDEEQVAEVGYQSVKNNININRNIETSSGWWLGKNADEYSNHDVRVLTFRSDKKPIAMIVNYDVQSNVMDKILTTAGKHLISADFVGQALSKVEAFFENKLVAMFIPGAAGDQAPILQAKIKQLDDSFLDIHESGYQLVNQLGEYLAESIVSAEKLTTNYSSDTLLKIYNSIVEVPEQKMEYKTPELKSHRSFNFTKTGNNLTIPIQLICFDNSCLLGMPPELNSEFGQLLRKKLGCDHAMICTLVNGAMKYLPEAKDFKHITYEAMNTVIGCGAAEKVVTAVENLKKY